MKTTNSLRLYYLWLALLGLLFYVMNVLTPPHSDDWHYCFVFGTNERIEHFSDVLRSLHIHYLTNNGRVTPHLFVQSFDGLLGFPLFHLANALMFMAFFHLLNVNFVSNKKNWYTCLSLVFALVFLLLPEFNMCLLWMSGACNYLWSATFLLLFCIVLKKKSLSGWLVPLLFSLGLFCGWTHEGLVIGFSAGLLLYYATHRKELTPTRLALLLGFLVGALLVVVAPGSLNRAGRAGLMTEPAS